MQVEYTHMTPAAALEYVRSRRPRVLLAPSQWKVNIKFSLGWVWLATFNWKMVSFSFMVFVNQHFLLQKNIFFCEVGLCVCVEKGGGGGL